MKPPALPPATELFPIQREEDALGLYMVLRPLPSTRIRFFQPFNEWATKCWNEPPEKYFADQESELLRLLMHAYMKGRRDAQQEVRSALGLP